MKVLFLCPYPLGESPSQRFRFEQYLGLIEGRGAEYSVQSFWGIDGWNVLYAKGKFPEKFFYLCQGFLKRFLLLFRLTGYEFVFLHREAAPLGPPVFEWIIAFLFRKKIIYDFDDAIWISNTSEENRVVRWLKCHSKVSSICRWSHKVSCGNAFLADFARPFNASTVINPTTIDTEHLHNPDRYPVEQSQENFVIGWTGTHSTLPYLLPILPVIESLWKRHPTITLMVIADKFPAWPHPFLKFVKWSKETEIADLMRISVGIMPLPDEPWAKGKCGFKALQYMSLEKPALVSPIGINTKMIEHGVNGYLCSTPEEWLQYMELMLRQSEMSRSMGKKGREMVINHFSVNSNASNFLSLFE